MFKFLSVKPNVDTRYPSTLLVAALSGVLFLTGCQQSETLPVADDSQTSEKTSVEDSQPMPKSDSAAARIKQFQPIYVAQAQSLQRRLQAEYESLQAADASDSEELLLLNTNNNENTDSNNEVATDDTAPIANTTATSSEEVVSSNNDIAPIDSNSNVDAEVDVNTSTEVGERDLTVLKRISLEPRKPVMLTEDQIIERYQQTMDALYQPVTTPLSAEDSDTLINMATLVPQLFEHAEIAGRVSAKSPALARLIIQHQVWEQIEAQQVVDMQQMKQKQQQEFEALMAKFNETIEGYDEQIAKYEQTLKEFQ
ncbi:MULTISPECIES: hypothetical protein [unclassified Psychrobacter]|uniref:hypothetical protein n=1 Tax=unclassified Psychrobacter TaxID=196806 RepID=UPI000C347DBA|nr:MULTISPECIES: hypothetical protein [unclassified Psychrobacter]MBA6244935.1 hypothetical protein [Psychrobacter sp. Urea-trap-18]MBA6286480.1 hypothetical protein [Psychrobacter sp. Urea-trap-16]MBA6318491.1 hypothetical protein [Psychrobacter sp. Urea-trap-20]MBA6334712.1 hypothetical protein [Psychrobacter sp. Urea-trap-19]PKG61350.1 hypothetical protein CXF63_02710 [Psychrobacter sp. Choline-3u-12]